MCGTIAGAWTLIQMYEDAYIRSLAAGTTLLIIYVCLKWGKRKLLQRIFEDEKENQ